MIEWLAAFLWKIAEPVLIRIGGEQLDRFRRWRARQAIRASSRKKIAILLTKIAGDSPAERLRQTLNEAIRREFGRAVEVTRLTELLPYCDGHEQDAELAARATARRWLADKNADLLIAGRDKGSNAHGETVLSLQFIAPDAEDPKPESYKLTDTLDLPIKFMTDLGAAIAGWVTERLSGEYASSDSLVALRIQAERLQPIVERLSPAFDADTRGSLLFTYALVRHRIGELANTNEDVSIAADAYRAALKEWPRESAPDNWTMAQNNLGNTLRILSEREDSTARLEEAIAAFRAVLEIATPGDNSLTCAGANFNLATALRTLDSRKDGTTHLAEAIAAFRNARDGLLPFGTPGLMPALNTELGDMLSAQGESTKDSAPLEEAIALYREALQERTRESDPEEWGKTQHELGVALALLGEQERGTARLEEALTAFRAALPALPAGEPARRDLCRSNIERAEAVLAERQTSAHH